jgi:hypothetical protein
MKHLLWLLIPGIALAQTELPEMEMHIFSQNESASNQPDTLRMVVFPEPESPLQHHSSDEQTLYLNYPKENQVEVYTQPANHEVNETSGEYEMTIYLDVGYRTDDIDWNKAHPSGTPNVLSELSWKNLDIALVEIGSRLILPSRWEIDGRFAYGTIVDGQNQDSDYNGNNRTQEFSRSNNLSDEGNTLDASLALGYRFPLMPSRQGRPWWSITPKVGFSYHAQNLKMRRGFQTIPATGHFAGLDSSYDASWYGPWAGLNSEVNIANRVFLTGSFEYHYAFYEGTGHWNLRSDLQQPTSFEHEAEGTGIVASLGGRVRLIEDLSLRLSVDYQDWKANRKGIDTMHFSDGTNSEMTFNEVNWESLGANIGLDYDF